MIYVVFCIIAGILVISLNFLRYVVRCSVIYHDVIVEVLEETAEDVVTLILGKKEKDAIMMVEEKMKRKRVEHKFARSLAIMKVKVLKRKLKGKNATDIL